MAPLPDYGSTALPLPDDVEANNLLLLQSNERQSQGNGNASTPLLCPSAPWTNRITSSSEHKSKAWSMFAFSSSTSSCSSTSLSSMQEMEDSDDLLDEQQQDNKQMLPSCCLAVWNVYYEWLQARPLLVKSITAFFLMGLADALAQVLEIVRPGLVHSSPTWQASVYRTIRFAIFGLIGAPWTHYYYGWLDHVLPPTPDRPWSSTTWIKVAIDQFLQAPALLALIISGMAVLEGRGMSGVCQDMELQYFSTLVANWKLWIPATIINIAFVQPILRVLYDNVIFFVWTIFLSIILNTDVQGAQQQDR